MSIESLSQQTIDVYHIQCLSIRFVVFHIFRDQNCSCAWNYNWSFFVFRELIIHRLKYKSWCIGQKRVPTNPIPKDLKQCQWFPCSWCPNTVDMRSIWQCSDQNKRSFEIVGESSDDIPKKAFLIQMRIHLSDVTVNPDPSVPWKSHIASFWSKGISMDFFHPYNH